MKHGGKQELIAQLREVESMIEEDPHLMGDEWMHSLSVVIAGLLSVKYARGASRWRVAQYLGRDVRTLERWEKKFSDFPKPRHDGHHEVEYNWEEVVTWKRKHLERT